MQRTLLGLFFLLILSPLALAQQVTAGPQVPPRFQLNQIEQAYLDQVLDVWERESAKVVTFKCPFERWEFNAAFGPGPNIPLNKNSGELSFQKPDKGSFHIQQIRKWQAQPVPPGKQPPAQAEGNWLPQPNAIGEHWVCDGAAVYEYRHDQKQLVVRPIPEPLRGKAIVDGPLPFLFGAEADKLKKRYWLRIAEQANPQEIWIQAMPKFQIDAANYKQVELILDRNGMLPKAMQVYLPDGSRDVYLFDIKSATVNGRLDRLRALFQSPRTPYGWKRIVEETPRGPAADGQPRQANQPRDAAR